MEAPSKSMRKRARASACARLASNSAAWLTAAESTTDSSSSVWRSSSFRRTRSERLRTLSVPITSLRRNRGTQISDRSPTFLRSAWLIRGSLRVSSIRIGWPLSIAYLATESDSGLRASEAAAAMPLAARVWTVSPSRRLTMAPSAEVIAWERSQTSCITTCRSVPAAAISRWIATIRDNRSSVPSRCPAIPILGASTNRAGGLTAGRRPALQAPTHSNCASPDAPKGRFQAESPERAIGTDG